MFGPLANIRAARRGTVHCLLAAALAGCGGDPDPKYDQISTSTWIESLRDENPQTRFKAVTALSKIGAPAVPRMIKAMKTSDSVNVRIGVCQALGEMGNEAVPAIDALREALHDPNQDVRTWAALSLGRIASTDPVVAKVVGEEMHKLIKEGDAPMRAAAAEALDNMGSEALAILLEVRKTPDPAVRSRVAAALVKLSIRETAAFDALGEIAEDRGEDPQVRVQAIHQIDVLLSNSGNKYTRQSPGFLALVRALREGNDARVHAAAAAALADVATTNADTDLSRSAIEALLKALVGGGDPSVQMASVKALDSIPPKFLAAAPYVATALNQAAEDKDAAIREAAASLKKKLAGG